MRNGYQVGRHLIRVTVETGGRCILVEEEWWGHGRNGCRMGGFQRGGWAISSIGKRGCKFTRMHHIRSRAQ